MQLAKLITQMGSRVKRYQTNLLVACLLRLQIAISICPKYEVLEKKGASPNVRQSNSAILKFLKIFNLFNLK